jgi:hypothetical protein
VGDVLFNPPFPAPAVLGLGLAVALLAAAAYRATRRGATGRRRAFLGALRLASVLLLVTILLRPMTLKAASEPTDKPVFCVLVDTSQSMNTRDVNGESRFEAVRQRLIEAAPTFATELGQRYEVAFYEFAGQLMATTFPQLTSKGRADGVETDVASALTKTIESWPYRRKAGMLLITDGRENAGGGADRAAAHLKSLNVPVWVTAVGTETQTKDLFVSAWLNQNFLFVKQPALLRVAISQTGFPDWYAKVNLYRDGEYVSSQQVMLKGGSARLEFLIQEDVKGTYPYRVEVEPLEGEADVKNNRRSVLARVIDQKSHVLVVEGQPSWDSKFMLRALRSDPNLQVTALYYIKPDRPFAIAERISTETAEKEALSEGVRLPRTREELYRYDCIVFGRDVDTALSAEELRLLKDYLSERGGSVVFSRGRAYTGESPELAAIEPVVWDAEVFRDVAIELTPEGRTSPIFHFNRPKSPDVIVRELPEMLSLTKVKGEKALSVVLAKGAEGSAAEELAAISYQRYGRGKVMTIATGGLWQWSFIPERLQEYDDVYDRFWGQMLRWLLSETDFLPGQDISLKLDKFTYRLGEPVRMAVWTKHVDPKTYRPRIEVTPEDGPTTVLNPMQEEEGGPYVAHYTPETEGEYTVILHNNVGEPREDTSRFTAYSDYVETRLVAADPDLVAEVANTTGGCEIPLERLEELPEKVRDFELSMREEAKPVDLWDRGFVFALLTGLLAVEWFVRRRSGLV